jgi:hypothetical protein
VAKTRKKAAVAEKTAYVWEEGRDEAVYRGDCPMSFSNSELKVFRQNRELFHGQFIAKTIPAEEKSALAIGSGVHERVLLPGAESAIVTIPAELLTSAGARNTRSKDWPAFCEANRGKILLTEKERLEVETLAEAIASGPAGAFFQGGDPEVPCKAKCPDTGVWTRCRFDYLTTLDDGRPAAPDLKTTGADVGDLSAVVRAIEDFGYARQKAFYRRIYRQVFGRDVIPLLVFLEKKPPFRSRVVEIDPKWLDDAEKEVVESLGQLRECLETGRFVTPGVDEVVTVSRPRWAQYRSEYQLSE